MRRARQRNNVGLSIEFITIEYLGNKWKMIGDNQPAEIRDINNNRRQNT